MSTEFKSSMQVTVRFFAGSTIHDAASEMVDLAQRLNCWVVADFNDVHLMACPTTNREKLAERCLEVMSDTSARYKLASAH